MSQRIGDVGNGLEGYDPAARSYDLGKAKGLSPGVCSNLYDGLPGTAKCGCDCQCSPIPIAAHADLVCEDVAGAEAKERARDRRGDEHLTHRRPPTEKDSGRESIGHNRRQRSAEPLRKRYALEPVRRRLLTIAGALEEQPTAHPFGSRMGCSWRGTC